jgi:hypothetical protein
MDDELKQNLTAKETWVRGLLLLLVAFLLSVAKLVTGAVVVVQFLFTVITGQTNENLQRFGASLSRYVYQGMCFLTYNTDTMPFPFSPWPGVDDTDDEGRVPPEEDSVTTMVEPVDEDRAGR